MLSLTAEAFQTSPRTIGHQLPGPGAGQPPLTGAVRDADALAES